jgi:hypothetical protein
MMMKRLLNVAIVSVALCGVAGTASAFVFGGPGGPPGGHGGPPPGPPRFDPQPPKSMAAPEIDPSSALAGLTLLSGGLAVMRGRRSRKQEG